ncbi:hypothetical protein AWB80_01104 [Caballeronia pedi]|uniref:Uncharacterized protein n=1 Tax=Caballeronia pedi TaxID=1777141 RepID=A0A157ZPK5_9BURK|nr:hypothetical protein [Caballeronia pedi]SAK47448.1 hypothetical protein AWB80_01104 [Caballeronia pedi]
MLIAQMRQSESDLLMLVVTISLAMLSIAARLGLHFVRGKNENLTRSLCPRLFDPPTTPRQH